MKSPHPLETFAKVKLTCSPAFQAKFSKLTLREFSWQNPMTAPINFYDISVWLGFSAIILLITTETVAYAGASQGLVIDKAKIRMMAVATGILFLAVLILRIMHVVS